MSLSNVARAKFATDAPRQIQLKTFNQQPMPNEDDLEEELNPVHALQMRLEEIKEDIRLQEVRLEQEAERFRDNLEREKEAFDQQLAEERKRELERGFAEGFDQGERAGFDAWQTKLSNANTITNQAMQEAKSYIDQQEFVILELSLKVAEKIIGQALSTNQETWLSLVKSAVKEMREHSPIKIVVSPSQYDQTIHRVNELKAITYGSEILVFVDDQLEPNDCRIESPAGTLDAGVSSQLKQLKQAMVELLGGHDEGK